MSNVPDYPVMQPIHDKIMQLVESCLDRHSKVLVTRLDLRYPQEHGDVNGNQDISKTMELTRQELSRKGLDPKFVWVREQNNSPHPHFHTMIILNGHKTQSPHVVQQAVEKHWGNTIDADPTGLVDYCNGSKDKPHENGKVITRKEGIPDYVHTQANYMAKPTGKGEPKDGLRDFGMSRLKPASKTDKK